MTKQQHNYQFRLAAIAVVFSALAVLFLSYYNHMGAVAGASVGF